MAEAFNAGVEPGGLTTTEEIRILLGYMLRTVQSPIKREAVTDIIVGNGMANYFDTEEAIADLLKMGHLTQDDGLLAVTSTGEEIAQSLFRRIPYSLRERSVNTALGLLKRRETEKDNRVTVEKNPFGGYTVCCRVMDKEQEMFSVSLRVADERQGESIKERFLKNPSLLYRGVLAILNGNTGLTPDGTQIVLDI